MEALSHIVKNQPYNIYDDGTSKPRHDQSSEQQDSEREMEEEEPTCLEYARSSGISCDPFEEPLPVNEIETLHTNLMMALSEENSSWLTSDDHLPQSEFPDYINSNECLTLTKDAAILLSDIRQTGIKVEIINDIVSSMVERRNTRTLRIEVPLLRSDHATDCENFTRRETVQLGDIKLPMEQLDVEKHESVEWSTAERAIPIQIMKEIENEKIELTRETLVDLGQYLNYDWTQENAQDLWDAVTWDNCHMGKIRLTPPITPHHKTSLPYIPSSPTAQLELLSDPLTLLSDDLRDVEATIFETDTLVPPEDEQCLYVKPLSDKQSHPEDFHVSHYIQETLSSPPGLHITTKSLKVDVPLSTCSKDKPLTTDKIIFELEDDAVITNSVWPEENKSTDYGGSEIPNQLFEDAFDITIAESVFKEIEQEQLQEADATKRVSIPVLDFSLRDPPWKYFRGLCNSSHLRAAQLSAVSSILKQYGVPLKVSISHTLQDGLIWQPIATRVVESILGEVIWTETELQDYLKSLLDVEILTSWDITWKPPCVNILTLRDGEDDGLALGQFIAAHNHDLASLVKKRKLGATEKFPSTSIVSSVRGSEPTAYVKAMITETEQKNYGSVFSRNLIGNAVDNFMELNGFKKQKLKDSTYLGSTTQNLATHQGNLMLESRYPPISTVQGDLKNNAAIPSIPLPTKPIHIIVSTLILKNRPLMRNIAAILGDINIVERDFTIHNTLIWDIGAVSRSPTISPLATEADIIPSPSTGIIFTTLQSVKQKPLPGQKGLSAIRERVASVCVRYEKLIVIISAGEKDHRFENVSVLNDSDAIALSSFYAFCASLSGSTQAYYVPASASTITLAQFLVAMISKEATAEQLIADETSWELFLRRAGMNPFAAQAVLSRVKPLEGVDSQSPSKCGTSGLSAFVKMDDLQRRRVFVEVLGGTRVLEKLDRILNAKLS